MKASILQLVLIMALFSCGEDEPIIDNETTQISSEPIFQIALTEDVEYAQGLSHESLNSPESEPMSLLLDIYEPVNDMTNRPVYMFIHGGSFIGGSKSSTPIVNLGNYYASRGWVFVSIDYRLRDDFGTVPQEWLDIAAVAPNQDLSQFFAIYPAQRDAKAALRWIVANADTYGIDTDYITVGGGSAGAVTAVALGVSELEDYRDEIDISTDPTLSSTNLDESYQVQTIIDYWGSDVALDALQLTFGHQRFDRNDPPLMVVHGTEDRIVLFSEAEQLRSIYEANQVPLAYHPLEGLGHSAWSATVDGLGLDKLAFDFIVEQQGLIVD